MIVIVCVPGDIALCCYAVVKPIVNCKASIVYSKVSVYHFVLLMLWRQFAVYISHYVRDGNLRSFV